MPTRNQTALALSLLLFVAGCDLSPGVALEVGAATAASQASPAELDVTLYAEPHSADELLSMLLSVDGPHSGLDADRLDGTEGIALAPSDHVHATYLGASALEPLLTKADLAAARFPWEQITSRPVRTLAWWAGKRCLMLDSGVTRRPEYVNTWVAACNVPHDERRTVHIDLEMPANITIQEWGVFHGYQNNPGTTTERDWTCVLQRNGKNGCPPGQEEDCMVVLPGIDGTDWDAVHKTDRVSIPVDSGDSGEATPQSWRVVCSPPPADIQRHYFISVYIKYVES